jgi:DNA-binding transcriptional LysR family regulator
MPPGSLGSVRMSTRPLASTAATWSRLQTFLAVVELGSVRAASEALHVTPPAVSAAVAALEDDLGTPLLAKAGRGILPTDAGRTFAGYCRTLLGTLEEARSAVQEADRSRLRLGAVATASEVVLPGLLASFARRYPRVQFSLTVLPRDDLFAAARHHEVDLVLAGRPPRGTGLVSRARRPNRLIVVGRPGHPQPAAASTWLLRGPGSGTREAALGLLAEIEAQPPTLTLGTHGACVAAAREGLGLTLVHEDAVQRDLATGDLVTIAVPRTPLDRPWHLVTSRQSTPSASLFVAHVGDPAAVGAEAFHLGHRPSG